MFIKVFVTPDAKREKVEETRSTRLGAGDQTLLISVKEPASANRANTRVREIVAERLKVRVGDVRILTGHRARGKILSVGS